MQSLAIPGGKTMYNLYIQDSIAMNLKWNTSYSETYCKYFYDKYVIFIY